MLSLGVGENRLKPVDLFDHVVTSSKILLILSFYFKYLVESNYQD